MQVRIYSLYRLCLSMWMFSSKGKWSPICMLFDTIYRVLDHSVFLTIVLLRVAALLDRPH